MKASISLKRREVVYFAIVVAFFLVMFRNLIVSGPFSMTDTEPPPPSSSLPSLFSLAGYGSFSDFSLATLFEFALSLLGPLNAEKILTILPFIVGVTSFHFAMKGIYGYKPRRGRETAYRDFVVYVLPFFYVLNPGFSSMLYIGDSPGILFALSIMPLVFLESYRLLKDTNVRNFALLSVFTVVSNLVYFEGFFFSFIFEVPLLLLSIAERKYKATMLIFASSVISFLSELPEEVIIYLVDVTQYKPISFKITYDIFIYSVMIFSVFLSLVLITWATRLSKDKRREPYALVFTASLVMFLFVYLMHYPLDLPLVDSLVLTITTFPQKVFLFSLSLLLLSFPFFRFTWVIFLVILVSALFPSYAPLDSTYSELVFSPAHPVISQFYQVYDYLASHEPFYTLVEVSYSTCSYPLAFYSWPGVVSVVDHNNKVEQEMENPLYGIKYVVTFLPMNNINLTLLKVFQGNPSVYVYENKLYQGLVLYPNGTGGGELKLLPNGVEVLDDHYSGNVIVLIAHSDFWSVGSDEGFLEVTLHDGVGYAYFNEYFDILYVTFPISLFSFFSPFLLLFMRKQTSQGERNSSEGRVEERKLGRKRTKT